MVRGNSTCVVSAWTGVACYGVFFNYDTRMKSNPYSIPGVDCKSRANFDSDIAGIGVVISFCLSTFLTTVASCTATVLDHLAHDPKSLLPARWQRRQSSISRDRYTFVRRILDRLILNFADQQLVTGYALLICAWVKLHSNHTIETYIQDYRNADEQTTFQFHFPNLWLPTAQFSLVVFLCMASSSSHLACVLVLRDYMDEHKSAFRLRIGLILVFSAFLAVTVALASSLTPYFIWLIAEPVSAATGNRILPHWATVLVLALCIAIPLIVVLAISWLCALQLMPRLKDKVQDRLRSILLSRLRRWFKLSKIWHSGLMRTLPDRWRLRATRLVKRCFWFAILGNEFVVFIIQVVLAVLSIIWIGLQRLATPPAVFHGYYGKAYLCSLHNVGGGPSREWASFGQLLPVILLLLPGLLAYGTYIEERDQKRQSAVQSSFKYAPIAGTEPSPFLPKRHSSLLSNHPSPYDEDFELEALNPPSGRHESEASLNSPFGRVHYGRQESQGSLSTLVHPLHQASSLNGLYGGREGGLGWPSGFSTGVDEAQQQSGSDNM